MKSQYGFDIQNECGIMIRLGHLHDLTPKFQKIVDALPVGTVANSESQKIEPSIPFKQGDVIATVVGFKNSHNVGFDYGVYDLRSNNEASKDPAYVNPEQAARTIYDCLKTNGRFIFEMGGKNNVANIRHAIIQAARIKVIESAIELLKPTQLSETRWSVDYVRLRGSATKL